MNNRRKIREYVLQAVYATEIGAHTAEHVIATVLKPKIDQKDKDWKFAESLYLRTLTVRDTAEEYISNHIQNWEISRLANMDRMIMRIAICELLKFDDIPPKVSINEAIEIAKKYSTAKSGKFVNGILDAIYETMVSEGKIKKAGRGLIDETLSK